MKILDRYIIRQFLTSFLFGLVAAILIFVIANMIEMLDDFIDHNVPTRVVFEYYFFFIPEIIKYMIPVAVLISALFITGRLSSQNELAAIKSSGISLYRLLISFMSVTFIICIGSVIFNSWVVPYANQKKLNIERIYLNKSQAVNLRYNIIFQEGKTRIISIRYFNPQATSAQDVSIQDFSEKDLINLRRRYDATRMQWIPSSIDNEETNKGTWILLKGTTRIFTDTSQILWQFDSLRVGKLNLTPTDIEKKQKTPDEMNFTELLEFIENQKRAGQDVARWLVELNFKIAFPFASIIMVLFAVPFASNRPRSGVAVGFGIALAVSFIYLIFMKTSQVFGYNGDLNPMFTAWMANIIFLIAGLINLYRVQK